MGFFKDLSQDVSQAIGELIPEQLMENDDVMVDTLSEVTEGQEKSLPQENSEAKSDKKQKKNKKKSKTNNEGESQTLEEVGVFADIMASEEGLSEMSQTDEPVEVSEELQKEIMSYLENGGLDNVVIDEEMMDEASVEAVTDDYIEEETILEDEKTQIPDTSMDMEEKEEIESIIESLGELEPEMTGNEYVPVEEIIEEKPIHEQLLDDDIDVVPVTPNRVASQEVSIITKGTSVDGSINASGALEIYGSVNGDVECLGKLTILGDVTGNAKANEVYINTSRFEGDVNSAGAVKIGVGTVVIGDITGTGAVIAGAVKGEIDISGPVILDSTAVVKGNIKAKSVQVNNGAVLQGFCSLTYSSVDIDDFFETEGFR